MSTLKALRSRIKTVRSTQKITTAMKLVSAAKLRKAQDQLQNFVPYDQGFRDAWELLTKGSYFEDLPHFICPQEGAGKLLIVFMADRGLCGSYNAGMARFIKKKIEDDKKNYGAVSLLPLGHKAVDFLRKDYGQKFAGLIFPSREQRPTPLDYIQTIGDFLYDHLINHVYASVEICYTHFESVLKQTICVEELLIKKEMNIPFGFAPFLEPSRKSLVRDLMPLYLTNSLRRAYFQSQTSEQASRMRAMDTATNNANDVLTKLHRTYNRTRQATITRELIEIISGANALTS